MRRHPLLWSTWTAYAAAWLLPVIKDGVTLPDGLPGWQAFRVAFAPVWPYEGVEYQASYFAVLAVLSALSNLAMLCSPLSLVSRLRRYVSALGWAALGAFLVDAHWFVLGLGDDDWTDLRIGYFLWWGSFLALAITILVMMRRGVQESSASGQGASRIAL